MRVDLIRLVAVSGAVATAMLASRPIGPISAQSLAAPTFTAAQQNAGDAIYKESCASCHDFKGGKMWPNDRPSLGDEADVSQADEARRVRASIAPACC